VPAPDSTAPAPTPALGASPAGAPARAPAVVEEAHRFPSAGFDPSGFAFDAVSGRFLFGARHARKIVVVGQESTRVVDLVRADSAQFDEVLALEIDPRRGDLWVASAEADGGGRTALHKLQLISGRPIARLPVPLTDRAARLTGLAVTAAGGVIALDSTGRRVWRLRPEGQSLDVVAELRFTPRALALAPGDRHVYLAHEEGLTRLDLETGRVARVESPAGESLDGIARLRASERTLLAVQQRDGRPRIVRLALGPNGLRVTSIDVVDATLPDDGTLPELTLSGGELYYTADVTPSTAGSADPLTQTVVRRALVR
jgi:hypothetical protein